MIFDEGDLRFDFSKAVNAKKFDDSSHGLSYCMKAVDFIVELEDRILFVEAKDPQHPKSTPEQRKSFLEKLKSRELINNELVPKCRDRFIIWSLSA